jgi:hypothetical protein
VSICMTSSLQHLRSATDPPPLGFFHKGMQAKLSLAGRGSHRFAFSTAHPCRSETQLTQGCLAPISSCSQSLRCIMGKDESGHA